MPTIESEYDVSMGRISGLHVLVCGQGGVVKVVIFPVFLKNHDFAERLTGAKWGLLRPGLHDHRVLQAVY